FGLVWNGYRSDIARTAFARPLKARQADTYRRLEEVHQMVIAAMKPGVRASALFHICTQAFAQRNVEFTAPHIGHSIGIGGHEKRMLQPFDDSMLEPGMVFMLEPLIQPGKGDTMVDVTKARRGKYTNIRRVYEVIEKGPYDALILMAPESVPYF